MGLALFKSGKFFEAFKAFEKVSLGPVSQNPKLWFYMGLSSLKLNESLSRQSMGQQRESDVYVNKIGFSGVNY